MLPLRRVTYAGNEKLLLLSYFRHHRASLISKSSSNNLELFNYKLLAATFSRAPLSTRPSLRRSIVAFVTFDIKASRSEVIPIP